MRRLAEIAVAVTGIALGLATEPVWVPDSGLDYYSLTTLTMLGPYGVPVIAMVLATVSGTLRAAHLVTRRAELASRRALGQSRGALVRAEARLGAAAGGAWGGAALVAGSVVRQASQGFGPGTPYWGALGTLAWFWLAIVLGAAGGWLVAAVWATRGMRDDASAGRSGKSGPSARREWWPSAAGGLAIAALATSATGWPGDVAMPWTLVLFLVSTLGYYLAIPALLVRWGSRLGLAILRGIARLLDRSATPASATSLASDSLMRRTPLRGAALGAIGLVVAVSTGASLALNANTARNTLADELAPDAIVATVAVIDGDRPVAGQPSPGWAPALDPAIIAELEADPGLVVVPAALLTVGVDRGTGTVLAVEAEALDGLDPRGLRPTYLDEDVVIGTGYETLTVGDLGVEVEWPSVSAPFSGVDRDWAEETLGAAPTSAVLVYGDLAAHDVGDATVTHPDRGYIDGDPWADASSLTLVAGPFLLGAVAIVVALAAASQRLRAREHATLVALGAQASTLRAAAALESGLVTAVGATLGLATGTMLGLALSALNGAGGWAVRLWNIAFDLAQAPWGALLGLITIAVGLAAGLAALVRVRAEAQSPADQLRGAEKEGVA
ncbi:FtsX-like permease family protein [Demequina rhizosphaerae]|uniref:FtsX-like permease family protein n=1 Tax=Demequina rhizosphaerae TaxID=1638985 RepID=UPI0007830280|nr:FtsX-like permease family protein [Demequina rhizosphaerae]